MSTAVLMVLMEPPQDLETQYDDWYEHELIPDHLRVPGIMMASRWICVSGWPRHMAMYDLTSLEVLSSPEYRSITAERFSAWSKWMLARVLGRERLVWDQHGEAPVGIGERSRGLVLVRLHGHHGGAAAEALPRLGLPTECRSRVFESSRSLSLTWGLSATETAVMIDAPALPLIPSWEGVALAEALGGLASELIGIWRYTRFIPSQRPPSSPVPI